MHPTLSRLAKASSLITGPFKRAQLGLYHGSMMQAGNNVPHSMQKTRRTWHPNVQRKRLQLETLDQKVRVRLTTRVLRMVKKHGSLDQYLMTTKPDLLGWEGVRLRSLVNAPHEALEKAWSDRRQKIKDVESMKQAVLAEYDAAALKRQKAQRRNDLMKAEVERSVAAEATV